MRPDPAAERRPSTSRSGATRPFVLVLFGAALLFLVVVVAVVMGERRVSAFRRSLQVSQGWAVAERNLVGVGEALAALDAPVNDAFAGRDLRVESRRVADARSRVGGELIALRATVPNDSSSPAAARVLAQVDTVTSDASAMEREADSVLADLGAGRRRAAEALIAPLGRSYLSSLDHLRSARSIALQAQEELVADQERSTRTANVVMRAMALLVLLACAVAFDAGLDADRRMRSDAEERELALQRLAAAETDLRLAQEKLTRATEERYRLLVDNVPDGIVALDLDGRVDSVNPAFVAITGWSERELVGRSIMELGTAGDPAAIEAAFTAALAGRSPPSTELRIRRRDGEELVVECTAAPERVGSLVRGVLLMVRDVTERRRIADELRRSEERFRRLVTYAPEGIYTLDPSGAITTANPALERLLGLPAVSILGRNFREFVHPDDLPTSIEATRQRLLGKVPD
ncbi:MAG TPA: PAS domain S-box protein, partial [Gemmatimonadales bacterium]|nr:PAS domain S-box protein [Gemmatimonadales bacterium]